MASEEKKINLEFEEGSPLPEEYKKLLIKMLEHEGERTGNKSFFQFVQSVLEVTEAHAPDAEARLIMANYVAEELKHCIMFQRIAVGLDKDLAT